MADKKIINPGTPVAGPYSPGIKVGNLIFVSGQGPAAGTKTIKEQTRSELENIKKIVEDAGAKVSDIVKVTVFMTDINDFGKMNRTYQKFFEENGVSDNFPTRSTVEISKFAAASMLIEIEAIAAL
jgi:2-iminobutanoate/2-iminopropanoate deaminase